jgi:hypothetical protein
VNYRTNNTTLNQFKVDPKNQLTNACSSPYTYDGNGNQTVGKCAEEMMVVYIYKYDDNPNKSDPWKDPWIVSTGNNDPLSLATFNRKGQLTNQVYPDGLISLLAFQASSWRNAVSRVSHPHVPPSEGAPRNSSPWPNSR